jgi:hypothetical protein
MDGYTTRPSNSPIITRTREPGQPIGEPHGGAGSTSRPISRETAAAAKLLRNALSAETTRSAPPVGEASKNTEHSEQPAALEKTIMVGVYRLVRRFKPKDWTDDDMADYLEGLEDLSAELVTLAVKRCIQNCTFMPQPAEIRAQIADVLERQAWETNHRLAERRMLPPPERRPPTDEEIAAVRAMVAEATEALTERTELFVDDADLDEPRPLRPNWEAAE